MLDVCVPGTGGMMPLPGRWLSCVVLRAEGHSVLLDCGEGTQIALKAIRWGFRTIDAICVTHYHADHVSGLVGMLLMLANSEREAPVTIYGPPGLEAVVKAQRVLAPVLPFEVRCVPLAPGQEFAVGPLRGTTAAGRHGLPCLAYRMTLPRGRQFRPERARELGVPVHFWRSLQRGEVVTFEGKTVSPDDVLGPPRRGLTVAYITDTRPTPSLVQLAHGADLLICEATFGDPADADRARQTRHMTFAEAATLAAKARAHRLWLTHFSPALRDPSTYAPLATAIFPNTTIAHDGLCETMRYPDESEGRSAK